MRSSDLIIHLHVNSPKKPLPGQPCNGCGVCCAVETCPMARLWLLQRKGPCRALRWSHERQRYDCLLLTDPRVVLPRLPEFVVPAFKRGMARGIAAGEGCDSLLDAFG